MSGRRGTRPCRRRGSRPPRRPRAASCSAARDVGAARRGAGASSTTFWCRRWIEQSRSPRTSTLPCLSPMTCTSMWRPRSTYGSTNTVPSPNADSASASAAASSAGEVLGAGRPACRGRRRRRDALTSSGKSPRSVVGCLEDRHAGLRHRSLGLDLGAHRVDRLGRRADPDQAGVLDRAGELGVLGQEAVAGVDGVGAGRLAASMTRSPRR